MPEPTVPEWRKYLWHRRKRMRLRNSTGFNDKVKYRMVADRRPELAMYADRVAVRDFVSQRVGADVLTEMFAVVDHPSQVADINLPDQYVMKATHGSGAMLLVSELATDFGGVPAPNAGWVRAMAKPHEVSRGEIERLCSEWLNLRYSHRWAEWAYTQIPPRVVFEEFLDDGSGGPPLDYKFFVFDGVVRLIQVDADRYSGHRRNMYAPNWELLNVEYLYERADDVIPAPHHLKQMIGVASELGRGADFMRVDLYSVGERIVFGELTNYPEGGNGFFRPTAFEDEIGKYWVQPTRSPRRNKLRGALPLSR